MKFFLNQNMKLIETNIEIINSCPFFLFLCLSQDFLEIPQMREKWQNSIGLINDKLYTVHIRLDSKLRLRFIMVNQFMRCLKERRDKYAILLLLIF